MKWLNGSQRTDWHWQKTPLSQNAFAGKRIAVIGGTNGIGRAIAHELVAKGAEVAVIGRTFRDQDVAGLHFVPASVGCVRRVCLRRNAPWLEFPVTFFWVVFGKMGEGKWCVTLSLTHPTC